MPRVDQHPPKKFTLPLIAWVYLTALAGLLLSYALVPAVRAAALEAYRLLASDDRTALQLWVQGFGWWGPVLIVALMIAQTLLSFVPMILVLLVSVMAYGPIYGALLGWFGAIIAALLGYGIGLVFGANLAERFVTPSLRALIEANVQRYGAWAILALRLSPLVPSDGVSFVAGLVKMRLLPFTLATIAGVTPIAIAVGYFGSSIERLQLGIVVITALSLIGLVGFVVLDRTKRSRTSRNIASRDAASRDAAKADLEPIKPEAVEV
jgi:uncharacterized membrane protein YdjX (TVP38/TMEM64 family)